MLRNLFIVSGRLVVCLDGFGPWNQMHAGDVIVVGSDAAVACFAASQALVNDDLFTIAPKPGANGFHQTAAIAQPVAGRLTIDMPRIETERTVIAMSPAADGWADKGSAMTALEFFRAGPVVRRRKPALLSGLLAPRSDAAVLKFNIVDVLHCVECDSWHGSVLQLLGTNEGFVRSRAG